MSPISHTEPNTLIAGDTARWVKHLPDYSPADGWALEYLFAGSVGQFSVTATAKEGAAAYDVHIPAVTTALWQAGSYSWQGRVKKGADVYTIASGLCTIAPALTAAGDTRSLARRALDAVEAYLADPSNLECASYSIKGRDLTRYTLPELWQHRDRLRAEVARENALARARAGHGPVGRIQVRW